ncbi:monovalent cation:proton antiporter-2 (CPA2) family protein [Roseibium porphyridii]|uniref:Monovalent cation:proton antiporter-2 (CPA2) family protein n=1 Tax=Roseibium porphyridii TaxID=2866279 RepID=A0ABY8F0H5_9HYPH|nr:MULTISPECIES: monovalent cation:proton antiporter-2 (CPA2) family protein [Stappiaceae]QFT33698.1 Glutathione-regulated potassium-efflux system protein KefC [Labrenzia sp. THAF82]WFE88957.1 monovalent cation:proton antiporter-2 (CPA2) family protein [Roseibium sp. KMA01]
MASEAAPPFFAESIVFLAATVVAVPIAKRLGLGSVVGYLAAGAAIGPHGLQLLGSGEDVLHVAELGVVLLLFVIGLELDPQKLWRMKRDIFGLGSAQVMLTGLTLLGVGLISGVSFSTSLVAGFGLALSSTAFALQILQERGQLSSSYGQRAFGILLMQDIAIVPLLAMVAILAPGEGPSTAAQIFREIILVLAAVAAVILTGRYLISPIFLFLAASRAREVMLTAALLVALGSAGIMHTVGLSMALGAFLAGVLLAESSFRHTLEADIEPFRSLLMGLFFVAVGMSLDVYLVMENWVILAVGVLLVMGIKGLFLWGLSRGTGSPNSDAMRIAVTLPQGGEFAFVLFTAAVSNALLDYQTANLLNAIVILTMLLTPVACLGLDKLAARAKAKGVENPSIETFEEATPTVLVVGFGRFGMVAAQILTSEGLEITAIDNRPDRIDYARKQGYKVYYGDATRADVLSAAGAGKAALIAMCIENDKVMGKAIDLIRKDFPEVLIFCRATDRAHALDLTKRGVDFQIRETFESSVVFGRAALEALGTPLDRIDQIEEDVRHRDEERLAMQLTEGMYAGMDRLHKVTPRKTVSDEHDEPAE